jgi:ribosomal protein S2
MNKRFKSISVPDLIITLKPKMEILEEASRFNVPIISVVDTNMNSSKFLYSLYMNDDSLESLSFLLELLQTAIEEGRRKEKIVFYNYFLKKIKKSYKLKNF